MNWIKINDQPLSKNNTSGERVIVEKNSDTMPPIFKGTTKLAAKLSRSRKNLRTLGNIN